MTCGPKRSDWKYEESREEAERKRLLRLQEEARQREARQREAARRALEEATARAVGERIGALTPEIRQLIKASERTIGLVDGVSRRGFDAEISEAQALLARALGVCADAERLSRLPGAVLVRENISGSSAAIAELAELLTQCRRTNERMEEIRFAVGPAPQRALARRDGRIGTTLARARPLRDGDAAVRAWSGDLEQLGRSLVDGDFEGVAHGADALETSVERWVAEKSAARERTLERRDVMGALQDTCLRLGFRILNPAELERSLEDPDASWRMVVDTRSTGKLVFTVEQDWIGAESAMRSSEYCFSSLEKVEKEMATRYGLTTHFVTESGDRPPPHDRHTHAEPHGATATQRSAQPQPGGY
jgi:hypothetical protein